jgi:hypothetical protein
MNRNPNATTDRPEVGEVNGLVNGQDYHKAHHENHAGTVHWTDPRLAKITRFRLLSDPGFPYWDVSYIHGVLKDGRNCDVYCDFPYGQLPKRGMKRFIIEAAKRDGVYAKGLGIFDALSTLC